MGGLTLARGDVVDVDVEGPRSAAVEVESAEPCLFEGLPKRDLLAARLAGVGVATRLEPAVELAVVQQEHPPARGRDDDRAPGQVALRDPTIEGVGVASDKVENAVAIPLLILVGTHVSLQ